MTVMKQIKVEKLTLNIGAGKDQKVLEKGMILLKNITGITPIKTITNKRIAGWGLRQDNILSKNNFDDNGNISFGIQEYIDIAEVKYDNNIGIMGLQVSISLQRPGFRIKRRKLLKRKIPLSHKINRNNAIKFMKNDFLLKLKEEMTE